MLLYSGFRDPETGDWISTRRRRRWVRDPDTGLLVPMRIIEGASNAQAWTTSRQSAQVAGAALSNSTVAASILPTHALYTLEPQFFSTPGIALRITAMYQVSNVVTTPGTLTLDVRFGAIIVFNGGAMQMSTTAHTTLPVWVTILLTARAVGSGTSANLMGQGMASGQPLSLTAVADSTTTVGTLLMPNTTPAVGTGFDSTVANKVDHFATFSVNTNPTNLTLQQYILEALN